MRYVAAPKLMTRFNGFPAVKVTGSQAPGYSSGQALAAMEAVAREVLPGDFGFAWAGQALQEKESGSTSSIAFIFGLIVVFLLLAAQFEKWTLPIAVVLTVPFAVLGALLLTWLRRAGERRLLPGRAGDAGGPGGEERDPDLRVRHRARAPRHAGARGGHRGGAAAHARHRHDLARVHPRLRAAGHRHRARAPTACAPSAPA